MMQKWSALMGVLAVVAAAGLLLSLSSCARDQELTNITIQPATETFGATNIPVGADQGLNVQLRAIGTYAHPQITKDLTNEVAWSSNTPGLVTVNSTGLLTATGQDCGNGLVSATVTMNKSSGNIATAYMTATVVCFTGTGPTGPTLIVNFGGGSGFVISTPGGIGCASTCAAIFPTGTTVTLNATPTSPSTMVNWTSGCTTVSGNSCVVQNLTTDTTVTVVFR
jgi:hypothetical protein